jgi:class 3 adenylate cyclase
VNGGGLLQLTPAELLASPLAAAERRQLTVLFSDLVGSTALGEALDPEEFQNVIERYYTVCGDAIRAHDGYVGQLLGDGVLAYFGYPMAHENSAERAIFAAFDILRALACLSDDCVAKYGRSLAARVGIHTGVVVIGQVGNGARREIHALGDTMNVAERVQELAKANGVVITAATRRLLTAPFSVDELGAHSLNGVSEPIGVYSVNAAAARCVGRTAMRHGRSTPFVGRAGEMRLLRKRWARAQRGRGHLVLVSGEPGIGKSRLIRQLPAELESGTFRWVEVVASPYRSNTPFGMLLALIEQELGWSPDMSPEARSLGLEHALSAAGIDVGDAAPLLRALVGVAADDRHGWSLATSEQQRRRLIPALVHWLCGLGGEAPLVLVLEDLHWADPSTLETLGVFAQQVARRPILVLMTARPEFVAPWTIRTRDVHIVLNRLPQAEVRHIVEHIAGELTANEALIGALVVRSDGVPLFAEELARAVVEQSADRRKLDAIPTTLQDSLLARLDRLGAAKEIAQVAAVIGREFDFELLRRVGDYEGVPLAAALERLVEAGLLQVRGTPAATTYAFQHALMQEAAYDALLKRRRRQLHATVARALADVVNAPGELLARHWTAAGDGERATTAWVEAAEQAWARSAFLEAATHYQNAIETLMLLPATPERAGRELELQLRRATGLQYGKGFVVPEAAEAVMRARSLSEAIGGVKERVSTLFGIWTLCLTRSEIAAAREVADQMMAIAEATDQPADQPAILHQALVAQSGARLHLCDLAGSIACADRALALPVCSSDRSIMASLMSAQPLLYSALAAALLGLADQARERCLRLLALGNAPAVRPFALVSNLVVHSWLRQIEYVLELRRGLTEHISTGQRLGFTQYLGLLAEAQWAAGAVDEGLATIDEALGSRISEERWHVPELLRIRALLLASGGADAAAVEQAYAEAIRAARRDGTRLFERRAATGLARVLIAHGRRGEVGDLLAPLQASFTEGFDSVDHLDTESVLAAL